jgi:hypothetical protein
MVLAGGLSQGTQANGAVMDEWKAPLREVLLDLGARAGTLAGRRSDATFLAARAFDALLRLEERQRVEVLRGLAAATDVPRSGRETKKRAEAQCNT